MNAQILTVDDSPETLELLKIVLSKQGHTVHGADSAVKAVGMLRRSKPDLIILDLMLPDVNGIRLTQTLRKTKEYSDIPIILLTSKDKDEEMVLGLKTGADDYIAKPFSRDVLIARIETVLRRCKPKAFNGEILSARQIHLDTKTKSVYVDQQEIFLTPSEFRILQKLLISPNTPIAREELIEADGDASLRVIDAHINSIRKKLGQARKYLKTVHGVGYKIV